MYVYFRSIILKCVYRYYIFALIFHAGLMKLTGEERPAGGILEDFSVSYIFYFRMIMYSE
jgi:hypothetical protein